MSDDRFKFISPGVFIEEIDQSQLPELTERMGPVVVGRFRKGPSNRPIKIKDFNELVDVLERLLLETHLAISGALLR